MSKIIDLSFLDEIRDIIDSADDNKVKEAYKYYKVREKYLGNKEQYYLQCLTKEMKDRGLYERKNN